MKKKLWKKTDKDKYKIRQSEQNQEKNMSKLYIGNVSTSIKENDLVQRFGLNATRYLGQMCSLNMPMKSKTGHSKGYAFASTLKHVYDELLKLSEVKFYSSQIKIEEVKSTKGTSSLCHHVFLSPAKS